MAVQFPEPAVRLDTPGLAAGRSEFTTDTELQAELRALVREGSAASAQATVRLLPVGASQLGVPIEALLFSRAADASPGERGDGRPTVLFIGQQHGDEPAGAEALLVLARQLAQGAMPSVLAQVNVLIVPRANPDGARRAQRRTANGIDLNRDHLLLRTPEAQGLARLVRDYRPMVVVDAHEFHAFGAWPAKFGVVRAQDVLLQYAMTPNQAEFVTRASEEWFRKPLLGALERERLSADWYHTLAPDPADRHVAMGSVRPDNARNVNGLRHGVSLLIETRGIGLGRQHLQRRVHSQLVAATSVLTSAAQRAADLQKLRRFVDTDTGSQACKGQVVVEADTTPSEYTLKTLDAVSGAPRSLAVNWLSALQLRAVRSRSRPCGYWLAADQTEAALRLRMLGLNVQQLPERLSLRGEAYRVPAAAWRDAPARPDAADDSGYATPVPVELQGALIDAEAGSYFVPLTQPLALLAVAALEPDSPSSYLAHGLIDRANALARINTLPPARLISLP
jgi:Zinc carboxypeptidase